MKQVVGLAFVLGLVSAAPAVAAPTPTPCTGRLEGIVIAGNLDGAAGASCTCVWVKVTGNVTVERTLTAYSTTFDKNVTVTGGVITIGNGWGARTPLTGNLTITGSSGVNSIACPNDG